MASRAIMIAMLGVVRAQAAEDSVYVSLLSFLICFIKTCIGLLVLSFTDEPGRLCLVDYTRLFLQTILGQSRLQK